MIPNRKVLQDWISNLEQTCPGSSDSTSPGYTYIIECGGLYKIGYTTDIARRISAFQVANVEKVSLVCWWLTLCADVIESELHIHFQHRRIRGEWHALTPADVEMVRRWAAMQAVPTYLAEDRDEREVGLSPRSPYRQYKKRFPCGEQIRAFDQLEECDF